MARRRIYQIHLEEVLTLIERTFAIPGRATWGQPLIDGEYDSQGNYRLSMYIPCEHDSFEEVDFENSCPIVEAVKHPPMF